MYIIYNCKDITTRLARYAHAFVMYIIYNRKDITTNGRML